MRRNLLKMFTIGMVLSLAISMSSMSIAFATDGAEGEAQTPVATEETTETGAPEADTPSNEEGTPAGEAETPASGDEAKDEPTTPSEPSTPTEPTEPTEPTNPTTPEKKPESKTAVLKVTWLKVGAGDSILIKLPNNEFILMDGGLKAKGKTVLKEVRKQLKEAGQTHLKYIINSHSDKDHVGGLITVINSDVVTKDTTLFYSKKCSFKKGDAKKMMKAAKKKGLKLVYPKQKYNFTQGDAKVTFAQPNQKFKTANENSLAIWLEFKNKKVLLTGDCSHHVQSMLLKKKADVMDMAHHGAVGGTSVKFFRRYGAPTHVVSSADGKTHGHPCPYSFQCLHKANKNAIAYRTDKLGNISCIITYNKQTKKTTLQMTPKGKNAKVYITKKKPREYWVKLARKMAKARKKK